MTENHDAIRGIIERQFGSLSWTAVSSPDWSAFERDSLPRPAHLSTLRCALRSRRSRRNLSSA
jgi:hypothetical protein